MPTETQVHFNKQYLEEEIRQLAKLQRATLDVETLQPIAPVLSDAKETLIETYRVLARAAKQNRELSSAGEWLIDNFYIIQEQIVQLTEDLPESYYKKLPRLAQGEYKGYPRTYEIVQMLSAISDNIIDQDNTTIAIQAYQEIDTLNLAEIWSVPLMNRLALILRLAERSKKLLRDRKTLDEIDRILNKKVNDQTEEPGYVLRKLSEIVDQKNDTSRFLIILAQRLQNLGMLTETERRWFDYKFSRWDTNLEEQLRDRAQRTSRLHLSIQNAISSLRVVSETDWAGFVESCSVVERILRLDPADMYSRMDFSTRDTYRKKVEKLSEHSEYSEQEVAEQALMMAESASQNGTTYTGKKMHIGYYLCDDGYEELAAKLNYRKPWKEWLLQKGERHPSLYFSFITIHLIVLIAIAGIFTNSLMHEGWLIVVTVLAAFLPALELSIVSTNRILSFLIPPRILPKLEFKGNIPDDYRTVVIVPTMLSSPQDVADQFELLEIRALANNNQSLQFVLLSDFHDAAGETVPSDEPILKEARRQVNRLNMQYSSKYGEKFLFFHRKRCWNEGEDRWMGWERKRGKIEEFNRLVMDPSAETTFSEINRDFLETLDRLPMQFVITLDADTKLPPGSARMLIGTAAHPLNRAEIDETGTFVKKGYGIFQPRVSIPPKSANKSWFARLFSGNVGLDPYTTAVSDIYQDLFGEGIYTGKGLYDLHAFETVLGDHFPENAILSHDLLESTYLRAALVTDIELFDDYPTTYLSYSNRNHRWIRGDWQILQWLFPKVPGKDGEKNPNPINGISKWKILDNMRRSLNPAALIVFLLTGWFLLPGSPLVWTAAVFGILAFPIYSSFSTDIFRRPERVGWKLYFNKIRADLRVNTIQSVTSFLFLPHQAYISVDAVIRTLYRMLFSRKKMLEWTTATQVDREHANGSFIKYWRKMWFNIFWAILCLVLVSIYHAAVLFIAAPICLGWIVAPGIAFYLTRTPETSQKELKTRDIEELRRYSRRTWHLFEQYMNEEHSWLPPDNIQEDPYVGPIARTSPTNIGLALVSICVAYEMGYITFMDMVDRLQKSLESMQTLDRYRGHFYNWYSTKQKTVLNPSYISTVDSGNLAGSLIVVQQALEGLGNKRWPHKRFWDGLDDTLDVVEELLEELEESAEYSDLHKMLFQSFERLNAAFPKNIPQDVKGWKEILNDLYDKAKELKEINIAVLRDELDDLKYWEWVDWLSRPFIQIEMQLKEIDMYLQGKESPTVVAANPHNKQLKYIHSFAPELRTARQLADICSGMIQDMDFGILYDSEREIFSIGYNVDRAAQDQSYYDLLASEARLASFIAIAKGEVPPEHWFRLSRRLTSIDHNEILLSWGGTMFEYLMPLLFMSRFDKTLLSNTYDKVVNWQKDYGSLRNRPWGFSESGYNILNLELHYQYRAFGVPGLGLRRGLAEDYVVAPYAGMLALMVNPKDALKNLRVLKEEGAYGANGFYEAVDYTAGRTNGNGEQKKTVVKMYMAHHQGMSLLAMANILYGNLIQRLFHNHPLVRSCELLLQERIPRGIPIKEPRPIDVELEPAEEKEEMVSIEHSSIDELNDAPPRTQILSNGRYSTLITHTGTGYSSFEDLMLTRWRPDGVTDQQGLLFYVRDLESGEYWSVGHQPVKRKADRYDSWFHPGKIQIARVDNWIESFMEVCVSPEDDIELRKITLTNYSEKKRKIELTSFGEVVLNTQQADMSHPAFSNLFVQTEYVQEHHSVLAKRRPREKDEAPVWLVHTIASEDLEDGNVLQIETDREKFIGRNRSLESPEALDKGAKLSGTVGNVRDPIVSLRCVVTLGPGEKKNITFGLGRVKNREEAIAMADRYDNPYATDRVFELASIYGNVELEQIGFSSDQAHYSQKLVGHLLFNSESLRADENTLRKNRRTQQGLWSHGISGDVPIIVYHIEDTKFIREVGFLLKAHALWRQKGLKIDLVFMNDHPPSYVDELQDAIHQQIQFSTERHKYRKKGGVYVLRSDQLNPEERILIDTVANVVLKGKMPDLNLLKNNSERHGKGESKPDYRSVDLSKQEYSIDDNGSDLRFFNDYGGFTANGKEYVVRLRIDPETKKLKYPPAPWINVIANPDFGFLTSEKGSGYTWSRNSRENKLTPWSNDAVLDPSGEAIYIRDEEEHLFWSPLPEPVTGSSFYDVHHGFGYSTYYSETLNIEQNVSKWVSKDEPIKVVRLQLSNTDLMTKHLSVFRYVDWVLGVFREESTRHIITAFDSDLQTIFARNHYNNEFAGRVAFATCYSPNKYDLDSYTSDRSDFIGRNRTLKNPRSLAHDTQLDQRFGIGFETCAASQVQLTLKSGESVELYFLMGETETEEEARTLIEKYRSKETIEQSLEEVQEFWRQKLDRIQIQVPIPEFNFLANGWLQYQNIACRMWARTGFYQAGGAFGFRDQLQDSTAACYIDPDLSRKQILLHAGHQFIEGDVLHWWHPPTDRGIRSRITDDLLWLPYTTAFYINQTGDRAILKEDIPFLTARELQEGEHEAYLHPEVSDQSASLYEHCCRAIDRSLTMGAHGIPLIGSGDWNDGMNKVGAEGKGESIWLGFFIYDILQSFIPFCKQKGDEARIERYQEYQKNLKENLNKGGWDGSWYRRAYYDDGTPLGSSQNNECRIDAIAQAWSVISGAATSAKAKQALQSADEHLVSEEEGIIRLLTPAFDKTEKNPGYIKGYIPGVRENGGQYTHAALWLVKAFAEMGNRERAVKLMQMLTPIDHARNENDINIYHVEPYAVAADIYGELPLTGMGGWTWYTGSAGWMYRVILESILGFKISNGDTILIDPLISPMWKKYGLTVQGLEDETEYNIEILNPEKLSAGHLTATLDGEELTIKKNRVQCKIMKDGKSHSLIIKIT